MRIQGIPQRSIREVVGGVEVIDQRWLPHEYRVATLKSVNDFVAAIKEMWIRGAPLIGATAAYGIVASLRAKRDNWHEAAKYDAAQLLATRPTAVNLKWALDQQLEICRNAGSQEEALKKCLDRAAAICDSDVDVCHRIGQHGLPLIESLYDEVLKEPVNILTHCNAGWLATVDWGTATSPIYQAHKAGIPVHVWVDETRPRNQGASLTAFELAEEGIPHTVITDNAGGLLMQQGKVDLVITGTDRTVANGDVVNKIGTYLKALAAKDNGVPFFVALPYSTLDISISTGADVEIEERNQNEIHFIQGLHEGEVKEVRLTPPSSPALNLGFDVTPARCVTGLITEYGVFQASEAGIQSLVQAAQS